MDIATLTGQRPMTEEEAAAWAAQQATDAPTLGAVQADAMRRIDADVDAVVIAVVGARVDEYSQAEAQARDYAAGGYTGDVPPYVADHAGVREWTAQAAADDILATATAWRGAQAAMRAARLARKQAVRTAADAEAVRAELVTWRGTINAIRTALGLGAA